MELKKVETVYHYVIPQVEKLYLTGLLSTLFSNGEVKVNEEDDKQFLKNILEGLKG